jgi:hypothetical protein
MVEFSVKSKTEDLCIPNCGINGKASFQWIPDFGLSVGKNQRLDSVFGLGLTLNVFRLATLIISPQNIADFLSDVFSFYVYLFTVLYLIQIYPKNLIS